MGSLDFSSLGRQAVSYVSGRLASSGQTTVTEPLSLPSTGAAPVSDTYDYDDSAQMDNILGSDYQDKKYVLFSGVTGDQQSVEAIEQHLLSLGVDEDNIIIHETPFGMDPFGNPTPEGEDPNTAAYTTDYLKYRELSDPNSLMAQQEYDTLKAELSDPDNPTVIPGDDVVFIGHSAGGQEAATLSRLWAEDQENLNGGSVDTVVTLGTPFSTNHTPEETRLVVAESDEDLLQSNTNMITGVLNAVTGSLDDLWDTSDFQSTLTNVPDNLDGNDVHINFEQGGHGSYYEHNPFMEIFSLANGGITGSVSSQL